MKRVYQVYTGNMDFVGYFEAESKEEAGDIAKSDQPGLFESGIYVVEGD